MDTEQIKAFLLVARYHNFTKASQHLHIGQPALSRQILDLERQLGTALFVRNNKVVQLTAAGEILQEESQWIIDRIDKIAERIKYAGQGQIGNINFATLGNFVPITVLISEILTKFPNIRLQLDRYDIETMNNSLICGDIDIGLTFEFALLNLKEDFDYKVLFQEPFCILVPKQHELYARDEVRFEDLQNTKFITLKTDYHPKLYYRLFGHDAYTSNTCFSAASNMESLIFQVDAGLGIGLVPRFIANSIKDYSFKVKYVHDLDTWENVVVAWNKANYNPVMKNFINRCVEFFTKENQ